VEIKKPWCIFSMEVLRNVPWPLPSGTKIGVSADITLGSNLVMDWKYPWSLKVSGIVENCRPDGYYHHYYYCYYYYFIIYSVIVIIIFIIKL